MQVLLSALLFCSCNECQRVLWSLIQTTATQLERGVLLHSLFVICNDEFCNWITHCVTRSSRKWLQFTQMNDMWLMTTRHWTQSQCDVCQANIVVSVFSVISWWMWVVWSVMAWVCLIRLSFVSIVWSWISNHWTKHCLLSWLLYLRLPPNTDAMPCGNDPISTHVIHIPPPNIHTENQVSNAFLLLASAQHWQDRRVSEELLTSAIKVGCKHTKLSVRGESGVELPILRWREVKRVTLSSVASLIRTRIAKRVPRRTSSAFATDVTDVAPISQKRTYDILKVARAVHNALQSKREMHNNGFKQRFEKRTHRLQPHAQHMHNDCQYHTELRRCQKLSSWTTFVIKNPSARHPSANRIAQSKIECSFTMNRFLFEVIVKQVLCGRRCRNVFSWVVGERIVNPPIRLFVALCIVIDCFCCWRVLWIDCYLHARVVCVVCWHVATLRSCVDSQAKHLTRRVRY